MRGEIARCLSSASLWPQYLLLALSVFGGFARRPPSEGARAAGTCPGKRGQGSVGGGGVSPTAGSGLNEHQESRCHGRWWVFAE